MEPWTERGRVSACQQDEMFPAWCCWWDQLHVAPLHPAGGRCGPSRVLSGLQPRLHPSVRGEDDDDYDVQTVSSCSHSRLGSRLVFADAALLSVRSWWERLCVPTSSSQSGWERCPSYCNHLKTPQTQSPPCPANAKLTAKLKPPPIMAVTTTSSCLSALTGNLGPFS